MKAELVRNRGLWKSIDDLEIAVASTSTGSTTAACTGEIGLVPPAELEATYYRQINAPAQAEASVPSLH